MDQTPKRFACKKGKVENIDFGHEGKMLFYGPRRNQSLNLTNQYSWYMVALRVKAPEAPANAEPPSDPEQVDKEGEVTKEIGTDAAKLRTGIGATKNQGIKAFQNMADMMDKLFKDVETSYGSFCTNVISTLSTF